MEVYEPYDPWTMAGADDDNQVYITDLILKGYELFVDADMNVVSEDGVHYAYARYKTQEELDEQECIPHEQKRTEYRRIRGHDGLDQT